MYRKRVFAILAGLSVVVLYGCSSDQSTEAPDSATEAPMAEVIDPASDAGTVTAMPEGAESRVFIDPVTGEMRAPTDAELAGMQPSESTDPALKQRPDKVEGTSMPDGSTRYDMRGQPQVEEKVCVQADGSIGPCPSK